MKKRIMMVMIAAFVASGIEAKSKKNKRAAGNPAQSMAVMPVGGGMVPPAAPSAAVGQAKTDQQFLEEQLWGMQQTQTNELKDRLRQTKMKNAENKKLIDQLLSEIVSGKVILYQK